MGLKPTVPTRMGLGLPGHGSAHLRGRPPMGPGGRGRPHRLEPLQPPPPWGPGAGGGEGAGGGGGGADWGGV